MATDIPQYPVGTDVTVQFTLTKPSDVSGITYTVSDETGQILQAQGPVEDFAPGDTAVEIVIPAALNTLPITPPPPANGMFNDAKVPLRGMRVIDVQMQTPAGIVPQTLYYAIGLARELQMLVNSFQTYEQALLESMSMPVQSGFAAASKGDRVAALEEAFFRLTKFGYRAKHPTFIDNPPAGAGMENFWPEDLLPPQFWTVMTLDRWALYLDSFKLALRRAQVAEANSILSGDPIADRRNAGILSETTGKSSMMFRAGKPINLGISPEALAYVKNFIALRMTTTRT